MEQGEISNNWRQGYSPKIRFRTRLRCGPDRLLAFLPGTMTEEQTPKFDLTLIPAAQPIRSGYSIKLQFRAVFRKQRPLKNVVDRPCRYRARDSCRERWQL